MLSRVAESVYWMARYVERAENVARIVDVNNHLMIDTPVAMELQWKPLVSIFSDEERFAAAYGEATEANVLRFLVCDPANPNSILSCLAHARENCRTVREIIPGEMWQQLNTLYLFVKDAVREGHRCATNEFFRRIREGSHLFFGLMNDTMTHGEPYRFAQLGRALERADKTSRVIDVKYFILLPRNYSVGSPIDNVQWVAVLKSVSAHTMYRRRYSRLEPYQVIQFLMRDHGFPRSIRHCLHMGSYTLHQLEPFVEGRDISGVMRSMDALATQLDNADVKRIIASGLHEYIDNLQGGLNALHNEIHDTFFAAMTVSR